VNQNIASYTPRTLATYVLALGLFALAGSIVYFSIVISSYREKIPEILESFEQTSHTIDSFMTKTENISNAIPPVMDEVAEIRKQIPAILKEVQLTRNQIPKILDEVEATRNKLPQIIKIVDQSSNAITQVTEESKAIRNITPKILAEVKRTRESIPSTLNRVDELIEKAHETGQKASSGAVQGFFTGIFTAPFAFVGNIVQSVFGMSESEAKDYTEQDKAIFTKTFEEVSVLTNIDAFRVWENRESSLHGKITLKSIDNTDGIDCRVIHIQIWKSGKEKHNKDVKICKNKDGAWESAKK
jgi:methyl-accepting chemotaxis protein